MVLYRKAVIPFIVTVVIAGVCVGCRQRKVAASDEASKPPKTTVFIDVEKAPEVVVEARTMPMPPESKSTPSRDSSDLDKLVYEAMHTIPEIEIIPSGDRPLLGGPTVFERKIRGLACRKSVPLNPNPKPKYHCLVNKSVNQDSEMARGVWDLLISTNPSLSSALEVKRVENADQSVTEIRRFLLGELSCYETTNAKCEVRYGCEIVK